MNSQPESRTSVETNQEGCMRARWPHGSVPERGTGIFVQFIRTSVGADGARVIRFASDYENPRPQVVRESEVGYEWVLATFGAGFWCDPCGCAVHARGARHEVTITIGTTDRMTPGNGGVLATCARRIHSCCRRIATTSRVATRSTGS